MSDNARNDILLVIGVIVLVIGLVALGNTFGLFPPIVFTLLDVLGRALVPLALVALGLVFIVWAYRGGLQPSMPSSGARLYRSRTNRMIAGVAGGLAEYFKIDPLLMRLIFVLVLLASRGGAILLYLVLMVVMPEAPKTQRPAPAEAPHA